MVISTQPAEIRGEGFREQEAEGCRGAPGNAGLGVLAQMTPAGSQLLYLVMKLC